MGTAWKLPVAGLVVLLLIGVAALVPLGLKSPVPAVGLRGFHLPDLNWTEAGGGLVIVGLVGWLAASMFLEVRALRHKQQELAKLALVANKTDNVVVITSREGLIEWVNDAFTRLSGYKLVEVAGKPPGAVLLGPLQNPQGIQRIRDGISQQKHFSLEMQCAHRNGHRYWLTLHFTPILGGQRELTNFIVVGADVTPQKKAEEELGRLHRRSELLLQAAGEGICGLDPQGQITFVNPAVTRFTGWQAAELIGQPVTTLVHQLRQPCPEDQGGDLFLAAVQKDGSVTFGEADSFRRKDGTTFPVEFTSTPVSEGSTPVGTVVVFRDITDRRQTEALRTRQTRQYALRADIAMALTVGETLDNFLHRSAQAIAKHLDGTLARIWVHCPEDNTLELQASAGVDIPIDPTQDRIVVGELAVGKVAHQRIPHLTSDLINESAPLERDWLKHEGLNALAAYPMQVEGRLVGVLALYSRRRIPEDSLEALGSVADSIAQGIVRKLAEEKVAEQAALLDCAQDAIFVTDLADRVIYWNRSAERLYGWQEQDAYGKRVDSLIYRDQSYYDRVRRTVLEKGEWRGELCQVNQGDETVVVESQWTLVQDDAGKPKSILVVNTDIREKKQMEAQFLRTQRMDSIGTLAGGIAHDLNNVLAPILMSVEMLKERFKDEASRRVLTILESSAKRGAGMVKQVLTFARGVDGERIVLQPRHLIKELAKIVSETFPKNIQIKTNAPESLWTILGDATQLHQVLLNLAVNARDAMPAGGLITVTAENTVLELIPALAGNLAAEAKPGCYVLVRVADTGTGIPPEIADKIFEPFFTTKDMGKGTGLGLSTVLGIVKSHGGFVQVHTEANKGTAFLIYLPASENPQSLGGDTSSRQLPSGHGELVLAVDDEAAVLSMMKETLETFGYRVVTAQDGAEAVAAFTARRNEIKAVVTDIVMPHMDGPATIRVLKKLDPDVRIIAASGLMDGERIKDATSLDHIAFLMKPFTAEKLLTAIHQAIHAAPEPHGG